MNLIFSKEHLNSDELLHPPEILRIKELLSQSQMATDDAMALDEELKTAWWQQNQDRFFSQDSMKPIIVDTNIVFSALVNKNSAIAFGGLSICFPARKHRETSWGLPD